MADCTGKKALAYIGALAGGPEGEEVLEFHSRLLLSHLAHMSDVSLYHSSYPWRVVCALEPGAWESLLTDMSRTWRFTTSFVDSLRPNTAMYDMFVFTRFQPFRDVMVKGEHLDLNMFS